MRSKEKAISIWNQFELQPLDMTCADSLEHSEIVVKNIIDFIDKEMDGLERAIYIDFYNEVLEDLKDIYRFKRYDDLPDVCKFCGWERCDCID
jgi:hypothetical protein